MVRSDDVSYSHLFSGYTHDPLLLFDVECVFEATITLYFSHTLKNKNYIAVL